MLRLLGVLALLLLAAPAAAQQQLEVVVQAPTAQALERAKAAFTAEGLSIASADGGVVASVPATIKGKVQWAASYTYRATVLQVDSATSRVVLSGVAQGYRADLPSGLPMALASGQRSNGERDGWHGWAKVERIAAALERTP